MALFDIFVRESSFLKSERACSFNLITSSLGNLGDREFTPSPKLTTAPANRPVENLTRKPLSPSLVKIPNASEPLSSKENTPPSLISE